MSKQEKRQLWYCSCCEITVSNGLYNQGKCVNCGKTLTKIENEKKKEINAACSPGTA